MEYKLGNRTLKIVNHCDSESPRNWDNLSSFILVGSHGPNETDFEFEGNYESRFDFIEQGEQEIRKYFKDVAVCLPVHVYKHSGIAFSTEMSGQFACRWDSGTAGFIVITKEQIRENWSIKRVTQKHIDHAERIAKAELETYGNWANGEVYGFQLEEDGEEIDSCYGFYGYDIKENGILDHVGEEWAEAEEVF